MAERIGTATIGINMDTRAALQALNRLSLAAPAALGSIAPAAAGAAAVLAEMAPASGVAATGILAAASAAGALKLGMTGVEDAAKAALDPSDPEAYAEALKQLSPNAKSFVEAIRGAEPAFTRLRKQVQDRLFDGLDKTLARTAKTTAPALKRSLLDSAAALNTMAKGVGTAAADLGASGTLGKALGSANRGLRNLTGVPGLVVKGFGQVAAAAGPSFERLTKAGAGAAERLSDALSRAFESGAMRDTIEQAVDLAKQLGQGLGNVGRVISNVFRAAGQSGAGLIGTFRNITGELAKVTASPAVQTGLRTLFETMGTVGRTAARLLGEAIKGIAPVITALGPPVQTLVRSLGSALTPVIRALSPILTTAAENFGRIVSAVSPLLPVIGRLASGALKGLEPVLKAVGEQAALLAESAKNLLGPALKSLPDIVNPMLELFGELSSVWMTIQNEVLKALQPSLKDIGRSLGRLAESIAPLVPLFTDFVEFGLRGFTAAAKPVIGMAGRIAEVLSGKLAGGLDRVSKWFRDNRLTLVEAFRRAQSAILDFVIAVVDGMPEVFHVFRMLATRALDAFGLIINAAAKAFGWLPGVGDKVRKAADGFNTFSKLAKDGLDKAAKDIGDFSRNAAPKLRQYKLEMNIKNWQDQIKEAKRLLSDKNLPPKKRAKLEAQKKDLEQKVKAAKKDLASIKDRKPKITASSNAKVIAGRAHSAIRAVKDRHPKITVSSNAPRVAGRAHSAIRAVRDRRPSINVSTNAPRVAGAARGAIQSVRSRTVYINTVLTRHYRTIGSFRAAHGRAEGGLVKGFPHGGMVSGPGTATSDSIPAMLSDGEFVIRAAAVRRFGPDLFEALNSMMVPRFQNGGAAGQARTAPAMAPVVNNYLTIANHGVIGSRREAEDWLAAALDNLSRQRRLPTRMGG